MHGNDADEDKHALKSSCFIIGPGSKARGTLRTSEEAPTAMSIVPVTTSKHAHVDSKIAGAYKVVQAPPVDFTFKELESLADLVNEQPRSQSRKAHKNEKVFAIRLSNNRIKNISNMTSHLGPVVESPQEVNWIDLSFNSITEIPEDVSELESLSVLYLHANDITRLDEIDKLAKLPNLKTLTLHGNPLENIKGYRQYALSVLPNLRQLDFCAVTKQDRRVAASWKSVHGPAKFKRRL